MIVVYIILGLLVLLFAVLTMNTLRKKPRRAEAPKAEPLALDEGMLAEHLSGLIQYETITSVTQEGVDAKAFLGLHEYLKKTYPLLHQALEREVVNEYSLLYRWKGSGSDQKPFLMMAHIDVVPVEEATRGDWPHAPFSGDIADGYVWGRGAIDMKGQVACLFDSVEHLLREGYAPKRDVYIAIGHDEESMGCLGAVRIVEKLKQEGIRLDFVIDEGGVVMDGKMLGIGAMVATIGICEKGYADIRLTAKSAGGHASRPPKETAVGTLAKAIVAIEKHPMKSSLNGPMRAMLKAVGGYMKFPLNVIAANLFITKPLLLKGLAAGATGAAMVRTTAAPTMLRGSGAPNVLADRAEAVVNFRIAPGETLDDVLAHVRKLTRGTVEVSAQGYNPSGVSSSESEAYRVIADSVSAVYPEYVVSPYLMIAATDSRWYAAVADGVYRFQPFRSLSEDLGTIHAVGERLSVASLREGVEFFVRLVKKADK